MEFSICGIMQICQKVQTLKYFGFQVFGLWMFDFQMLKFDGQLFLMTVSILNLHSEGSPNSFLHAPSLS